MVVFLLSYFANNLLTCNLVVTPNSKLGTPAQDYTKWNLCLKFKNEILPPIFFIISTKLHTFFQEPSWQLFENYLEITDCKIKRAQYYEYQNCYGSYQK